MTPNLAVLEIQSPNWRMPRLWLPLFLLWIPLILLSPLIFLVLFGLCMAGGISPWRAISGSRRLPKRLKWLAKG